ncbi:hypothetical protein [Brevundimonas goettingensis]|uniref:Secreted protein n=1 Tax=Brevundimonas goettingensis TaxID=2774190 RepID=A0A975BZU6_9CAUL|nr:hypothetical protein [Brevundimonas goettingensis]QTC91018.1 hypothetical protein IFJ75_17635 [Brevundimonas goettingensis]
MRGLASLAMLSAALLLATPLLSACGEPAPEKTAEVASAPAQTPVMPEDAPPQEEAEATITDSVVPTPVKSCAEDIGAAASAKLVQRCIAVSPATHPPCNAQNECAAIQGEIDRSCAMYGPGETKPAECAA